MMMTYNAIPTSDVWSRGFHNRETGATVSTSWADLVSYLLVEAEKRFGERDQRWMFTGVTFADQGPNIYHPGNRAFHVAIRLDTSAAHDPTRAYFQLAHEVAHLLGPNQDQLHANYLEEGMCTAFQIEMARSVGITEFGELGPYGDALTLVERLTTIEPDAIRKIRGREKDLRQVDVAMLASVIPDVPDDLAADLVRQFPRH